MRSHLKEATALAGRAMAGLTAHRASPSPFAVIEGLHAGFPGWQDPREMWLCALAQEPLLKVV